MSERMEEEMVAPIEDSKEIGEATKKPTADHMGDSMGKEMREPGRRHGRLDREADE
jgi:hypothetical protein